MPDTYAAIGNPISHSKSPLIHATFARQTGQDLSYTLIEGPLGQFSQTVDAFRASGASGLNITAPFKLDAFAYANERSSRAQLAGAVNAMKFDGDRVQAENFDGLGLVRDIQENLGSPLRGLRVLMLGAGGAARGAALPLLEQSPARLVVANRTLSKARDLATLCRPYGVIEPISYFELASERFDVVLNATSASLRGELPPVPAEVFAPDALAYELAYGKGLTPFLRLARNAGIRRMADGVGMLVEQAAEAFSWWRGIRPQTRAVIEMLTVPLKD
jgi:shikimate dehydrogenase